MHNYSWWQVGRLKLFSFDWSYCQQMPRKCMRRPSGLHFWEECWKIGWELLCWDVLLQARRVNSDLRLASSKGIHRSKSLQRLVHFLIMSYSYEWFIIKIIQSLCQQRDPKPRTIDQSPPCLWTLVQILYGRSNDAMRIKKNSKNYTIDVLLILLSHLLTRKDIKYPPKKVKENRKKNC